MNENTTIVTEKLLHGLEYNYGNLHSRLIYWLTLNYLCSFCLETTMVS